MIHPKNGTKNSTPPNVGVGSAPAIHPIVRVPNVSEAVQFYRSLGFELVLELPRATGPDASYAILRFGTSHFHVAATDQPDAPGPTRSRGASGGPLGLGVAFYCTVPNVGAVYEACLEQGWKILAPPQEEFWGDRVFACLDPYGYEWNFAQHVREVTADEMTAGVQH